MPPLYLLDTNILVHLVRGDGVGQYVRDAYAPLLRDPRPLICVVSDGELCSLAL
jgi:predicted nucleic acid-binding protein